MTHIVVNISAQQLMLYGASNELLHTYVISTAKAGVGQTSGSYQTPTGQHHVAMKVGDGVPKLGVFKSRLYQQKECTDATYQSAPDGDWILSRILWLAGNEPGHNQGGDVDSLQRYIYLHATPKLDRLGQPMSMGCINLSPDDMIDLYDRVSVGTQLTIMEEVE